MEKILMKYGYNNALHENEWRKKNWTIRFGLTEMEAFDNPRMNTPGLYYKKKIEDLDLETLLDEIEGFLKP